MVRPGRFQTCTVRWISQNLSAVLGGAVQLKTAAFLAPKSALNGRSDRSTGTVGDLGQSHFDGGSQKYSVLSAVEQ